MRLTTFAVFVATLLGLSACTHADTPVASFTVDAGDVPRRNAPVAATVQVPGLTDQFWGLAPDGDVKRMVPVQVEPVKDQSGGTNSAILRWIEPELLPGKPRLYELYALPNASMEGTLTFVEGEGFRDLKAGTTGIYRHMNRYDPADHAGTFKPFHHVFGMHGEGFITNGPGSAEWGESGEGIRFPHHRGLFFGYNKTPYGDFWHGRDGKDNISQQHRKYDESRQFTGPVVAREASVNEWVAKDGKPVIRDTRELTTWRVSDKHIVLDFDVTLESLTGEAIPLGGDPQHAGFHFRAADEVGQAPAKQSATSSATTSPATTRRGTGGGKALYTRPAGAIAKGNDVWADCPWVHAAFTIKGNPYGVSEMNGKANPQPTVFSTRPYGRFGAFFEGQSVSPEKPLKLKYRFVVRDGSATPDAKQLEAEYQNFVSPVNVTIAK